VFVKICGITNREDAGTAVRCGASALGFVFCSSQRRVTPEKARAIREGLPPNVRTVGVFMDEPVPLVREVVAFCGLDMIQLHGGPPPGTCRAVGRPCIRAFRVRDETSLDSMEDFRGAVHAVLLDAWDPERAGGAGRVFDWSLVPRVSGRGLPVILAGGLTPENVGTAVDRVRPYGVDVSSGVERSPGLKDADLIRRFVDRARLARAGENGHV
jgi:phosphoribosylanthranilate isomerase